MNSTDEKQKRENEFNQKSVDFIRSRTIDVYDKMLHHDYLEAEELMSNLIADILRDDNNLFTTTNISFGKKYNTNMEIVRKLQSMYDGILYVRRAIDALKMTAFNDMTTPCVECSDKTDFDDNILVKDYQVLDYQNYGPEPLIETPESTAIRNVIEYINEQILNQFRTLFNDNNEYSIYLNQKSPYEGTLIGLFDKTLGNNCPIRKKINDDLKFLQTDDNKCTYISLLSYIDDFVMSVKNNLRCIFIIGISATSCIRGYEYSV